MTISTIHSSNSRSTHTPPKAFASDINMNDKLEGFGIRNETLEEEVDFGFGKYKGMEAAALIGEEMMMTMSTNWER